MPLSLRPALPADEPFLYRLAYENFYDKLMAHNWDPKVRDVLLTMQVDGQRSAYAAQYPRADHAIVLLDDQPVGRMILDRGPEIHQLVDIVIDRPRRSNGIGTVILRAVCAEAELMRKPLRLQVEVRNRARELYRRLGFRVIEDLQVTWVMERTPGAGIAPGAGVP
jgi:ribosomal protein S18 acetylase RimI-like enzyme